MRVVALPIVCQTKKSRSLVAALLLCAIACARTGLYPGELGDGEPIGNGSTNVGSATSAGGQTSSGGVIDVGGGGTAVIPPNAGMSPIAVAGAPPKTVMDPPMCEPTTESCNGRDDDCNGAVDDLPPQACPGGGSRFCVAGRLSECPRRCDVCVPGSVRVCQNSFCSFWGEQECAADGQGFGHCAEANPPAECDAVAKKFKDSKQLEQCCIDNGYCCVDEHDLDQDGNRREMLGACSDIACQ